MLAVSCQVDKIRNARISISMLKTPLLRQTISKYANDRAFASIRHYRYTVHSESEKASKLAGRNVHLP